MIHDEETVKKYPCSGIEASCDTCRWPGACCSGFVLNLTVRAVSWREDVERLLKRHRLEFFEPYLGGTELERLRLGEVSVQPRYRCRRLGADGRCTDYHNRPELCRIYEPGTDPLCAEYAPTLRGIPIVRI